jgi:acyl-CoA thioesterase-2
MHRMSDETTDQDAVDALVRLLDLERIEDNLFRGVSPSDVKRRHVPPRRSAPASSDTRHRAPLSDPPQRVFGGQVAGQALVAAARTVEQADGTVHSLHAYFLRPGDPSVPIVYDVDRIRDGRSFTTRRVVAIQHGKAIFNLQASFHTSEPGFEHQLPMPEGVPGPEELPTFQERYAHQAELLGEWFTQPRPIDTRPDWTPQEKKGPLPPRQHVWLKAAGVLPDDPILHTCVLTYASDMTLLDTTLLPHGGDYEEGKLMMASLDHAMWFHRPFRADEWLLYAQDTPSASGGRGIARGLVYRADGALIASVVQEGLIREMRR